MPLRANFVLYSLSIHYILRCISCVSVFPPPDRPPLPGTEQGTVEGLAYEPVHGDIYWTCNSCHSISRISVRHPNSRHQLLVPLGEMDKPRGIAIDSCDRSVEWGGGR